MNLHSKIQLGAKAALTADDRAASIDWSSTARELANYGAAVLPSLLAAKECREIAALYPDESKFRSHIVMARHGFGKGEYKYFAYPLPEPINNLRTALYSHLAPVANEWNSRIVSKCAIPPNTKFSSNSVTRRARNVPHRCCCNMLRETSTRCTRTSTAI